MRQYPPLVSTDQHQRSPACMFFRDLGIVIVLMFLLAGLLTTLTSASYLYELRLCLAIGITIQLVSQLFMKLRKTRKPDWKTVTGASIVGIGPGIFIGTLVNGHDPLLLIAQYPSLLLTLLTISLVCTMAISYYFYSRGVIVETRAALRQEEFERISSQQRLTEANLRVLQAQIEPHFLFNTLSNILSLIGTRPDQAEQMLGNFTEYLRASLQRTRADRIELREELTTVRAFLEIMAMRMGKRLTYEIDVSAEVLHLLIPPLLLQPLVENAVEHGIDPVPEGGTITVRAKRDGHVLVLEVSDSGVGISTSNPMGVGMTNIRERLQLLYQEQALFQVTVAVPHGTTVRLTIPIANGENRA